MRYYTLLFFLIFSLNSFAQNWRGVSSTKRNYFCDANKILKYTEVINSSVNGLDSVFTFYPTVRDSILFTHNFTNNVCLDTLAASWMGKFVLRSNTTGEEKYSNFNNDTILIKTLEPIGSSWTLATLDTNIIVTATVSNIDTQTVDGIIDSIKAIALSVTQGGSPYSTHINNYILKLSKNHGWISVPDWYCFQLDSNALINFSYSSTQNLYSIFNRLDSSSASMLKSGIDVHKKFQTGNMWIYFYTFQYSAGNVTVYIKDSIASSVYLGNNIYNCNIKRQKFTEDIQTPFFTTVTSFVDTVFNSNCDSAFTSLPYYTNMTIFEYTPTNLVEPEHSKNIFRESFVIDTFMNINTTSIKYVFDTQGLISTGTCTVPFIPLSNYKASINKEFNSIMGITYQKYSYPTVFTYPVAPHEYELLYCKLGGDSYGQNFNLRLLSNNDVSKSKLKAYPNPANEKLNIEGIVVANCIAKIYSIDGKEIISTPLMPNMSSINIEQLKTGVYFLKLVSKNYQETIRFVKE